MRAKSSNVIFNLYREVLLYVLGTRRKESRELSSRSRKAIILYTVRARFCKTKMCTNFRSTSRSEKLRTNFRNFGRETCREREMNFRRKFREIGSCRTCTWRVQTTKMCGTQSSCENSYTLSKGLSRNFVRTFVVQNLSNISTVSNNSTSPIIEHLGAAFKKYSAQSPLKHTV